MADSNDPSEAMRRGIGRDGGGKGAHHFERHQFHSPSDHDKEHGMSEADGAAWIGALGGLVGGLATAAGLFYAARQIQSNREDQARNERWRRTEFAQSLIDRLSSDDELAFCTRALDWAVGPLIIPQKYRVLFPEKVSTLEHSWQVMSDALKADLDGAWRTPEALTYRYCFDAFFSFIEAISRHISVGILRPDQLTGLDYQLQLVRNPRYQTGAANPFRPFLDFYYPGLSGFIWQYGSQGLGVARRPWWMRR